MENNKDGMMSFTWSGTFYYDHTKGTWYQPETTKPTKQLITELELVDEAVNSMTEFPAAERMLTDLFGKK